MSDSADRSVLKAAGAMGAATFLSRIMGLVREQVFAYLFGAGNMMDAFNVAFRIPNLLRDLFAEGAMSASLVPTFTRARVEEGELRAWRLAGLVFRFLFVTVGLLAVIGMIFASDLVALYAGAFKQIPGKFELTVRMTRIMFPFFPLVALAAAYMGVLNSCGAFFIPAFASALFNLASVVVGVTVAQAVFHWGGSLGGSIGGWSIQPIEGMALGVLVGGMVQAGSQLPLLYRKGYRWIPLGTSVESAATLKWPPWWQDPRLRQMLTLMLPGIVGLAATQINILVNTVLASSQGPGAVSWLNYAFRLMQFPIGLFGVSLASATLPKVSRQWAMKDLDGVCDTLSHSLRSVFAINLPASAGLAFLGGPIIELIFQYGRFSPSDTQATAFALAMYSVGLTAYSAVKVLVPACYALGNTRLPVISSVLTVALTLVLNLLMVKSCGYWGLALGTSLAAIFNSLFLIFVLRDLIQKRGGKFIVGPIFKEFLGYTVVALAMGMICGVSHQFLSAWVSDYLFLSIFGSIFGEATVPLTRSLRMMLLMSEGIIVLIMLAKLFQLKGINEWVNLFVAKVKNKLRWA